MEGLRKGNLRLISKHEYLTSFIIILNFTHHNLHLFLSLLKHLLRPMSSFQCKLVVSLYMQSSLLNIGWQIMQFGVDDIFPLFWRAHVSLGRVVMLLVWVLQGMIFGIWEVESISNANDVRSVLVLVSIVVSSLVILESRDVDLLNARNLLTVEKASSLIL